MKHEASVEQVFGEVPDPWEKEMIKWAEESASKSLSTVHESLRQLIALTTALLAGSAVLLGQVKAAPICKGTAVAFLMGALLAAFWGTLPLEARIDRRCPAEIRAIRHHGIIHRSKWLARSFALLIIAFCILFGGMLAGGAESPKSTAPTTATQP